MNFIKTTDELLAKKLLASNFTLLSKENAKVYVFLNDGKLTFSDADKKQLVFTNVIAM